MRVLAAAQAPPVGQWFRSRSLRRCCSVHIWIRVLPGWCVFKRKAGLVLAWLREDAVGTFVVSVTVRGWLWAEVARV